MWLGDVVSQSSLSELFWKKHVWDFAGISQILWHRTLLPLWDSCFSTTCVLLSTSAYFLQDVWTSSFEAPFPLQLPNSIRKCIHSFLRLLIPLTTGIKYLCTTSWGPCVPPWGCVCNHMDRTRVFPMQRAQLPVSEEEEFLIPMRSWRFCARAGMHEKW